MIKDRVQLFLYALAIVLFCSNYGICEYLHPELTEESIKAWWYMKSNIYGIIIALLLLGSSINKRGWIRFVLEIGIGFALSNVVDRMYFNCNEFTSNDLIMIMVTFLIAILDFKKEKDA